VPKGDADNLRADLDDGYAQVANLLLEALCCAPLSAAEYAVVLFVIRRTYGWAKHQRRDTGKVDCMTAEQIASGTALSRSGVHKSLQELTKANIIIREPAKAGNYFSYGMNTDIAQWGLSTPDWKTCKQTLRDARDNSIYNPNGLQVSPKRVIGITQTGERSNPSVLEVGAVKPTATGDEGTSTTSLTTSITTKNDSLSPAAQKRLRQAGLSKAKDEILSALDDTDIALVQAYVEIAANENKSKQISLGGEVTRLKEIVALRDEFVAGDAANGQAAWRYGMSQANSHNAPNANYVKKAAKNWNPDESDGDGEYRRPQFTSPGGSPAAHPSAGGPISRLSPEMRQWRSEYEVVDDVPEYKVLLYEFYDLKKEGRNNDALVVDEKLKKMSTDFYLGRQAP